MDFGEQAVPTSCYAGNRPVKLDTLSDSRYALEFMGNKEMWLVCDSLSYSKARRVSHRFLLKSARRISLLFASHYVVMRNPTIRHDDINVCLSSL